MIFESNSAQDTFQLGRRLGSVAKPGMCFCLDGDLGTGKTVLTQGFAAGLGIHGPVSSPTFTIVQVYEDGRLPLYHFDAYRIADIEEMEEIGYSEYFYSNGICLIEWASLIQEIIPEEAVRITIEKDLDRGFDYRRICLSGIEEEKDENTGN